MRRRKWLILGLYLSISLLFSPLARSAVDTYPFSSPQEAQRFQALTQEIRCVVCHGQSLAQSDAALAEDFRRKIHELMEQHQSDAQIKAFLVQRYGEAILFSPPLNPATSLLWFFPALLLLLILGGLFGFQRRQRMNVLP